MPTKRRRIPRELRLPRFAPEAIALFAELEAYTDQDSQRFREGSKRLASLLGLGSEWLCSCAHVNDRSIESCHPPNHPATADWHRVRNVRLQLLAATNGQHHGPTIHERRESNHTRTDRGRTAQDTPDHSITLVAATRRARL
jgi:hypothetical protein